MPKVIRELAAKLSLQAESFNNSIKDAQKELKEFEKNFKPSLSLAKELGTGMAVAGGAVVAGMLAATKSAVDFGDALNDARQRTGIAVETLARFGFAAEQSGSSVAGLGTGLKFLAKNMEGATGGGKAQLEAFKELGISVGQLAAAHGDVNAIMLLTADRFAAMEDGSEKTALAMKIFGKSGADLIPMLNEGSAGLKVLGDQAQAAGLVMSQETALASDQLNDSLNLMKASALGASVQIASALVPSLQSAAEIAVKGTQAFAGFIKEHQGLTTATFAAGLALTATGTALVAIAVIVPKLSAGLALLNRALAPLGIAIAGVQIAVAALGVAVGVGIGMFANYLLEVTGLQRALDGFTNQALKSLGFQWGAVSDAQKSAAFTASAVAKGWTAAKVEASALAPAVADLTVKTRTYDDFVAEGIAIQAANAVAAKEMADKKKEAADAADALAAAQRRLAAPIRETTAAIKEQSAALAAKTTGYLNPSAPDTSYDPNDPFGLNAKNAALVNKFSNPAGGIAAQPALPAALNLNNGGDGSPMGPPIGGAGSYFPGGWVNGSYYPESGKPQGTSSFNGGVSVDVGITVTRVTSVEDILAQLKRGIGLEDMARQIQAAMGGLTSTKGA